MRYLLSLVITLLVILGSNNTLAQPGPIQIGALFSLTGFGASAGTEDLRGLLLAQEEINAAGGIGGHPVEIITEDFASDAKAAVSGFLKLATVDKVTAIVGPNYSEFVEVVVPAADRYGVPAIATSGYPSAVLESRQPGFYAFVLWPPLSAALEPLLGRVISSGAKRVIVLAAQNGYYEELSRATVMRLQSAGVTVETISVPPDTLDLKPTILAIKKKAPDALISFLLETGQIGSFFRDASSLRLKVPVFTDGHLTDDKTLTSNMRLANGVIFFRYDIEAKPSFREKYALRYGAPPAFTAAKGYDALYGLKEAIERCGSSADKIRECLANLEWEGASGMVRFNKYGALDDRGRYTKLYTVTEGTVQELAE